jgi:hypothetical protein
MSRFIQSACEESDGAESTASSDDELPFGPAVDLGSTDDDAADAAGDSESDEADSNGNLANFVVYESASDDDVFNSDRADPLPEPPHAVNHRNRVRDAFKDLRAKRARLELRSSTSA